MKWKTPIPDCGWSTPVVMGGQVWLTTATEDGHDFFVLCLDAESGQVRFDQKLFHADKPEPLGNSVNCYASPSPVIEPGRVYVSFGSYGTACLDTATQKTIWQPHRSALPALSRSGFVADPVRGSADPDHGRRRCAVSGGIGQEHRAHGLEDGSHDGLE